MPCHLKNCGWSGADCVLLGLREKIDRGFLNTLENLTSGMIDVGSVHAHESKDLVVWQETGQASANKSELL
jgi:hypothetical protein